MRASAAAFRDVILSVALLVVSAWVTIEDGIADGLTLFFAGLVGIICLVFVTDFIIVGLREHFGPRK